MTIFNERMHGYILELLGIYNWEYAPAGKIYVPEDEISKMENVDLTNIYRKVKDNESFIREMLEENIGAQYCDVNLDNAYTRFMRAFSQINMVGDPYRIAGGDAIDSFQLLFKDSLVSGSMNNLPSKITIHIDDPTIGEEVRGLKKHYRGMLRSPQGKREFTKAAYTRILEEEVFIIMCYKYGCQPQKFTPSVLKIQEDDTIDISFDVDEWMSYKAFGFLRELVIKASLQKLIDEMEVETEY